MNPEAEMSKADKLIKLLYIIIAILITLNIIDLIVGQPSWQITRLINIDIESNVPTWFSSIILAIAAFLSYKCSLAVGEERYKKRTWQLLSLGFLAMSCDEVAMIHEHLGATINKYFTGLKGLNSTWIVILGPFVLILVFIFIIMMKKSLIGSKKASRILLFGVGMYIVGAFFLEATVNVLNKGNLTVLLPAEHIIEELFEMSGAVIIIKGLLEHYKFLTKTKVNP